jgi:hypothetical protein
VKANRVFRLIHRRGGWAPAQLAEPDRVDHIEVVDIASGEAVLFWDCDPREATRRARALRADLASLDEEEFVAAWSADPEREPPPRI